LSGSAVGAGNTSYSDQNPPLARNRRYAGRKRQRPAARPAPSPPYPAAVRSR
jgi:hypothetical protein